MSHILFSQEGGDIGCKLQKLLVSVFEGHDDAELVAPSGAAVLVFRCRSYGGGRTVAWLLLPGGPQQEAAQEKQEGQHQEQQEPDLTLPQHNHDAPLLLLLLPPGPTPAPRGRPPAQSAVVSSEIPAPGSGPGMGLGSETDQE